MLIPDDYGRLRSAHALLTAFMAPRLHGEYAPDGRLDISLWGGGRLGRLSLTPLAGPYVYSPNGVANGRGEGLYVAQSAPALTVRGARLKRFDPASRCAAWDLEGGAATGWRDGSRCGWSLPWGVILAEARGVDLVLATGSDRAEAERGLTLSVDQICDEHAGHDLRCDRAPRAGPLLRSLVRFGVHAALASIRKSRDGGFAGLAAGPAYSAPARTYFRDGYWTLPMLLQADPEAARAWIDAVALGVHADGEAPSGVLTGGAEQIRRFAARGDPAHDRPGEWWSDHFDSPLLFVLAVADFLAATGDAGLVDAWWTRILAAFERYAGLARAGGGLPLKPRHDRDWADNVFRSGAVAYDVGLWIGAADAFARLAAGRDARLVDRARQASVEAQAALERLWRPDRGWFADYDGENHLALDSLTLLRFDAVTPERATSVLEAMGRRLTRPWGLACVDPPYALRADLRGKSAFPGRYHNGGDWPWLDGLYAGELLRRGRPGWEHALTAWWRESLVRSWTSPVEHFSPAYGRGSLLQAWSSLPAAVALRYAAAVGVGV